MGLQLFLLLFWLVAVFGQVHADSEQDLTYPIDLYYHLIQLTGCHHFKPDLQYPLVAMAPEVFMRFVASHRYHKRERDCLTDRFITSGIDFKRNSWKFCVAGKCDRSSKKCRCYDRFSGTNCEKFAGNCWMVFCYLYKCGVGMDALKCVCNRDLYDRRLLSGKYFYSDGVRSSFDPPPSHFSEAIEPYTFPLISDYYMEEQGLNEPSHQEIILKKRLSKTNAIEHLSTKVAFNNPTHQYSFFLEEQDVTSNVLQGRFPLSSIRKANQGKSLTPRSVKSLSSDLGENNENNNIFNTITCKKPIAIRGLRKRGENILNFEAKRNNPRRILKSPVCTPIVTQPGKFQEIKDAKRRDDRSKACSPLVHENHIVLVKPEVSQKSSSVIDGMRMSEHRNFKSIARHKYLNLKKKKNGNRKGSKSPSKAHSKILKVKADTPVAATSEAENFHDMLAKVTSPEETEDFEIIYNDTTGGSLMVSPGEEALLVSRAPTATPTLTSLDAAISEGVRLLNFLYNMKTAETTLPTIIAGTAEPTPSPAAPPALSEPEARPKTIIAIEIQNEPATTQITAAPTAPKEKLTTIVLALPTDAPKINQTLVNTPILPEGQRQTTIVLLRATEHPIISPSTFNATPLTFKEVRPTTILAEILTEPAFTTHATFATKAPKLTTIVLANEAPSRTTKSVTTAKTNGNTCITIIQMNKQQNMGLVGEKLTDLAQHDNKKPTVDMTGEVKVVSTMPNFLEEMNSKIIEISKKLSTYTEGLIATSKYETESLTAKIAPAPPTSMAMATKEPPNTRAFVPATMMTTLSIKDALKNEINKKLLAESILEPIQNYFKILVTISRTQAIEALIPNATINDLESAFNRTLKASDVLNTNKAFSFNVSKKCLEDQANMSSAEFKALLTLNNGSIVVKNISLDPKNGTFLNNKTISKIHETPRNTSNNYRALANYLLYLMTTETNHPSLYNASLLSDPQGSKHCSRHCSISKEHRHPFVKSHSHRVHHSPFLSQIK